MFRIRYLVRSTVWTDDHICIFGGAKFLKTMHQLGHKVHVLLYVYTAFVFVSQEVIFAIGLRCYQKDMWSYLIMI